MPKLLLIAIAVAGAAWIAGPERAAASSRSAAVAAEAMQTEVGAKRKARHDSKHAHRHAHKRSYKRSRSARVTVHPVYRSGRYVTPLIHPYDLYVYRRPFFVPGPPPFVRGIRRDGMGTAAYGFGVQ